MKLVHSSDGTSKSDLERDFELQKERLIRAAQRAVDIVKRNAPLRNWITEYPLETAMVALVGGFIVARVIGASRRRPKRAP